MIVALSYLLTLLGTLAVVAGLWMLHPSAALIGGGVVLVLCGVGLPPARPSKNPPQRV